jgi:hypothetical protein
MAGWYCIELTEEKTISAAGINTSLLIGNVYRLNKPDAGGSILDGQRLSVADWTSCTWGSTVTLVKLDAGIYWYQLDSSNQS